MKQILVLGGGAAGMAAAITAAEQAGPSAHVVLVEANPKLGKKLLATGNGRCNLDNANMRPSWYFTSDQRSMEAMLQQIAAKADPLGWFAAHGLLCREPDEAGRIYPYANQAADVWALLTYWLEQAGVEVLYESKVQDLWQKGGRYTVLLEDGRQLQGQAVICALGGSAGPQFGTDGFGTRLAALLGLRVVTEYPCLVPLACEKRQVKGLGGIRVKGTASLYRDGKLLRQEQGEVQFTDYGISGIAVMQLSGLLYPGQRGDLSISLDVFPQMTEKDLADYLTRRAEILAGASVADFLTGLINRKVGLAVWDRCNLGSSSRLAGQVKPAEWAKLAAGFKNWRFTGLEPTGWKNAQTTGGGIALDQLNPTDFSVKGCPSLYFVGETVDCAGSCGGYNLHWAFGSGILAGKSAAAQHQPQADHRPHPKKQKQRKK